MYDVFQKLHSYWAYLVVLILFLASVNAIIGLVKKKEFGAKDFRLSLFTLIVTHIQLLIGLAIYFMSPMYKDMKVRGVNDMNRQLALEHPLLMIIAIILITLGYSKHKKHLTSKRKFKTLTITYTLALIAILSMIPWDRWF